MKGQDRLIAFVIVAVFVLLTWLIGNHQNDGPFLLLFWWYWQYIPSNMAFVLLAFVAVAILWRLFPMLKKRELGGFKASKIVGTFCGLSVLSPFITALINYSWAPITGDPPLGFMGVIEEYNSANNVDLNNGILIIGFVILITIIFVVVGRRKDPEPQNTRFGRFPRLIMLALITVAVLGILSTPSLMHKDFSLLIAEEAQKTEELKRQYEEKLVADTVSLETELDAIDAQDLRQKATDNYKKLIEARRSFDSRFALSPREKTQLLMLNLSSDSTKTFHDLIRSVAKEASPNGANINVNESPEGVALHIDFEMASMTSGESGTRTKHHTKDSLKKEVISLISRVTNDIFRFSSGLNVSSIYVGCSHFVTNSDPEGSKEEINKLLYKIKIQKNQIPQLTNDPFLDIYSITKYFKVEEDNFDQITISTS